MENPRRHGKPPYVAAALHGGPGAHGEMAPVARELARDYGVLEPMQTAGTIAGQALELSEMLKARAQGPAVLIGHSWGAWLAALTAALHPDLVRKLILVGCGPFEASYAQMIAPVRLSRLPADKQERFTILMRQMQDEGLQAEAARELGELLGVTDTYEALRSQRLSSEDAWGGAQRGSFGELMAEVQKLRSDGELLGLASQVRCPVVAIHGDYDPHPAEGVREPLERRLTDFRFVLLPKCGHSPWLERHARTQFFDILRTELAGD